MHKRGQKWWEKTLYSYLLGKKHNFTQSYCYWTSLTVKLGQKSEYKKNAQNRLILVKKWLKTGQKCPKT